MFYAKSLEQRKGHSRAVASGLKAKTKAITSLRFATDDVIGHVMSRNVYEYQQCYERSINKARRKYTGKTIRQTRLDVTSDSSFKVVDDRRC